jgi:hypothetical protein
MQCNVPVCKKYRDLTPLYDACKPPFDSPCYAVGTTQSVMDNGECAAEYSKRYNASDPTIVSQLAEVNVEIDAACGQLKTKVHHPPMCCRQCTTLHAVYTLGSVSRLNTSIDAMLNVSGAQYACSCAGGLEFPS